MVKVIQGSGVDYMQKFEERDEGRGEVGEIGGWESQWRQDGVFRINFWDRVFKVFFILCDVSKVTVIEACLYSCVGWFLFLLFLGSLFMLLYFGYLYRLVVFFVRNFKF